MIDIEQAKPGKYVWVLHHRIPTKLRVERLDKQHTCDGVKFNIVSGSFSVPFGWCYGSEMELITDQINYWRDLRLNMIVLCTHEWANLICSKCHAEKNDNALITQEEVKYAFDKTFQKYYGKKDDL